jgi:tetratricopeptide (TPR) repeat protein
MGDTDKAVDLYREALAAGGEEEMTRVASINLAELLRDSGKADEALKIYSQYSEQHPDDILGQLNYAIALMDAGQKEQAQQIFSGLLARNDLDFRQWTQVGIGLYRAQNFERAADAFAHAHEIQPLNKEVLENLANARYQSDDYAALIPLADTLVRRYPYERVNYNLLANAQRETGEQDTALSILQKRDALTFEFLRSQLVPGAEGAYSVEGQVMNRSAPADAEIEVPFEFLDKDGAVVTTENLALALPPQGEMAAFQLQVQSETPIVGFRYKMAEDVGS